MARVKRLEDLEAWQDARQLAGKVYALPSSHPVKRDFGFRDQLCRACVSTMANVAEAWGRDTSPDKARFLSFARGSAYETLSILVLGRDVGYLTQKEFTDLEEITRKTLAKITALHRYLRSRS